MNKNDVIETEIISSGMDGEGIARVDGRVVFIPYTLKGERVRAVVKQVKKNYASASVIKILVPSPDRVNPKCPHYYKCGGCDMGHVSPEYRKNALIDELKNNLKKIANIQISEAEFVGCDDIIHPRNKLSMPFGLAGGKVVLGLYRQNTHIVEPVDCMLAPSDTKNVAKTVCEFANEKRLSVYDEKTGNGLLRHLVIREIAGKLSATLVVNSENNFDWECELASRFNDNIDFFICPNTRKNNVILGNSVRLVRGNARLDVEASGVKAELSPLAFFQVNDYIRDKLYAAALKALSSNTLIDLYSGIGITSNLAAKNGMKVIAVECVTQAVADADRTAELNGNTSRITNICGNAEDVINRLAEEIGGNTVDVLVDPPRKGCDSEVMRAVAGLKPQTLVYISCNHATMCRDIKTFTDAADGYSLAECKIFDMFPYTHHTETLVVLKCK